MLHLQLKQVLSVEPASEKPYDFNDDSGKQRKGISCSGTINGLMGNGKIAIVTVKGKSVPEADTKIKSLALVIGKAADFPVIAGQIRGGVLQVTA
jgi:hypothetical protein